MEFVLHLVALGSGQWRTGREQILDLLASPGHRLLSFQSTLGLATVGLSTTTIASAGEGMADVFFHVFHEWLGFGEVVGSMGLSARTGVVSDLDAGLVRHDTKMVERGLGDAGAVATLAAQVFSGTNHADAFAFP